MSKPFVFKQFHVAHDLSAMKVGTDGVLLGAWTTASARTILDVGTGSGLIALMLAQKNAEAIIHAVDIDEPSILQAKENFQNSPWADRLHALHQDFIKFDPGLRYDLIVSNPPYFINSTPSPDSRRQQVRHNTLLSLTPLLQQVNQLLADDGKFNVILPPVEGKHLLQEAASFDLFPERTAHFIPRSGKPAERLLITFSRTSGYVNNEYILHYNDRNEWSEDYKNLTKDFYNVL